MKIAHFSLMDWEKEYVQQQSPDHEHIFLDSVNVIDTLEDIKECEVLTVFIYNKVPKEVIDSMPRLKAIFTRSTGFDHIDIEYAKIKNIPVTNAQAYGSQTIAEHTFALLLNIAKHINILSQRSQSLSFNYMDKLGFELNGKTIGVIGSGRIGKNVIRIALAFSMRVKVFDVFQDPKLHEDFGLSYSTLDEVLTQSDILTLHVPLTPETQHICSWENIITFKKGLIFLNTARGGLIKNENLLKALDQGYISYAGLDALEDEDKMYHQKEVDDVQKQILKHDRVLFTPHSAYYTKDALQRILSVTLNNIFNLENNYPLESVCS